MNGIPFAKVESSLIIVLKSVKAKFIPTEKNKPAEEFLPTYGFKKSDDYWIFDLNEPIKSPDHLKIIVE